MSMPMGLNAIVVPAAYGKDTSDATYDSRYKTIEGTTDIINKIVENVYGDFLPEATSVLLYNDTPVGFVFANITGGKIVNIPIVAIAKAHQGLGLSKNMLSATLNKVLEANDNYEYQISEINTNTETNNYQALKMYRNLGFKEDYNYPQSYLPVLTRI